MYFMEATDKRMTEGQASASERSAYRADQRAQT